MRKHGGARAGAGRPRGSGASLAVFDLDSPAGLEAVERELGKSTWKPPLTPERSRLLRQIAKALLVRRRKTVQRINGTVIADTVDGNGSDPVAWLATNLTWTPFTYEGQLLRDHAIRLRVVRKSRQVGITTTLGMEAIWKAYTYPGRTILIVSPSDRQSKILMGRIQVAIEANPSLSEQVTRQNTSELWLKNGSAILSLPNNPDRIRGFSATDIYLDEAAHFLNDGPVMAAIKPMLIATKGTFTICSTPFGKRGLFWDQYRVAMNEQGKPGDVKAYDFYPSTISPLITAEQMEQERINLTDLEFNQEYEGQFIEQVDTYLPLDLIMQCVDPSLVLLDAGDPTCKYVMGVDFAKQRDETVITLLEETKVGTESVWIVRHISAWTGMDYTEQLGRIRRLSTSFKITAGTADQTGVGQSVIEGLHEIIPSAQGFNFTMESKVQLASTLRSLLEQKKIKLPNDKRLIMQLNGLTYKVSNTGNMLFESPEKAKLHDDYLWSLALACYTAKSSILIHGHARVG